MIFGYERSERKKSKRSISLNDDSYEKTKTRLGIKMIFFSNIPLKSQIKVVYWIFMCYGLIKFEFIESLDRLNNTVDNNESIGIAHEEILEDDDFRNEITTRYYNILSAKIDNEIIEEPNLISGKIFSNRKGSCGNWRKLSESNNKHNISKEAVPSKIAVLSNSDVSSKSAVALESAITILPKGNQVSQDVVTNNLLSIDVGEYEMKPLGLANSFLIDKVKLSNGDVVGEKCMILNGTFTGLEYLTTIQKNYYADTNTDYLIKKQLTLVNLKSVVRISFQNHTYDS